MEEIEPVWDGRASDTVAEGLNRIFEEYGLPYTAVVDGEPRCYETVRYGWICTYDYLPVYITRNGRRVKASLVLRYGRRDEETGFGYASGGGEGCAYLRIIDGDDVVELEFPFYESMHDYIYGYSFEPGPC